MQPFNNVTIQPNPEGHLKDCILFRGLAACVGMRIVAALGIACVLLGSINAEASLVVRSKSNRKNDFYDRPQVSTPRYSRPATKKQAVDPNAHAVRSPERVKVQAAPKPKQRKYSHISEGP